MPPSRRKRSRFWRGIAGSRNLQVGLLIILIVLLVSLGAPWLTSYSPTQHALREALQEPSAAHWLGTDNFGRDIYTRILYGGRTALKVGTIPVAISFSLGVLLGSVAGFWGGRADEVIMRLVDATVSFPYMVLVIAILAIIGPGLKNLYVSVGLVGWTTYARIIRGEFLSIREREYVEAAHALGARSFAIITRHILPNAVTPAISFAVSDVVLVIMLGTALSFLGLGVQPPTADWGAMVSEGRVFIYQAWWMSTFPGFAIVITGLGFSFLGDGLAEVLNPKEATSFTKGERV